MEDDVCFVCGKVMPADNWGMLRGKIRSIETDEEQTTCIDCFLDWEKKEKLRLAEEYKKIQAQNEKLLAKVDTCAYCGKRLDGRGIVVTRSEDGRREVWCSTCMFGITDRIRSGRIGGIRPVEEMGGPQVVL